MQTISQNKHAKQIKLRLKCAGNVFSDWFHWKCCWKRLSVLRKTRTINVCARNAKKKKKKRLTFDFFIWNDRSKSSVSESLFYFTSTGRKGVVIILCAHIQYLNQQYPVKVERAPKTRIGWRRTAKTYSETFNLGKLPTKCLWHLTHLSSLHHRYGHRRLTLAKRDSAQRAGALPL